VQGELAIERASRPNAEQERDDPLRAAKAEEWLPDEARRRSRRCRGPHARSIRPGHRYGTERNTQGLRDRFADDQEADKHHAGDRGSAGGKKGRGGRPVQSDQSKAEIVEWWKPGWRVRIR
jgi:hypothetical protein